VFDTLSDSKIKTVVCRHEQNAAFIAGGIGRLTGKAGVTLVPLNRCAHLAYDFEMNHRIVESNRIKMHIAEDGEGPLVILCHGYPELWYSWRHQLKALAGAGYHVVAPDQRGYGQTDRPEAVEDYNIFQLSGDIIGLVDALGESEAVVVGHDWGSPVAWICALVRPDIFRAVVLLSTPYLQRSWTEIRPTQAMKQMAGEKQFYQLYVQEPGKTEHELEADVRKTMLMSLYSGSGDAPPYKRWRFLFGKSETLLDTGTLLETLPAWLTEADLDFYTEEFKRTGFRGGLNWYRNIDRVWELTPFLTGAKIRQPSLFIAGEFDGVITIYRQAFDNLEETMPGLRKKVLVTGAGHWIQQERPNEVNDLLIEFLASL
jgi:pimeloyl-ACP methyl ester carboxylesterase